MALIGDYVVVEEIVDGLASVRALPRRPLVVIRVFLAGIEFGFHLFDACLERVPIGFRDLTRIQSVYGSLVVRNLRNMLIEIATALLLAGAFLVPIEIGAAAAA